jgi:hypothetical protein
MDDNETRRSQTIARSEEALNQALSRLDLILKRFREGDLKALHDLPPPDVIQSISRLITFLEQEQGVEKIRPTRDRVDVMFLELRKLLIRLSESAGPN